MWTLRCAQSLACHRTVGFCNSGCIMDCRVDSNRVRAEFICQRLENVLEQFIYGRVIGLIHDIQKVIPIPRISNYWFCPTKVMQFLSRF